MSDTLYPSNTTFNSLEDLKTCPYNVCHQIRPERMHYHLVKCQKSNPHIKLERCPFNATHHIRESALQNHMIECPDRYVLDLTKDGWNDVIPGQHGDLTMPTTFGTSKIPKAAPVPSNPARSEASKDSASKVYELTSGFKTMTLQKKELAATNDLSAQASIENYKKHSILQPQEIHSKNFFVKPPIRARSPSPATTIKSIPKLHRHGNTSTATEGSVSGLRRPRVVITTKVEQW